MISGITFIHNGVEFDYCFEEAIRSMLPVCDEVIVVNADSTDTTGEKLGALQVEFGNIFVFQEPWKPEHLDQAKNIDWTMDLANRARELSKGYMILYVQGDEVIHEDSYPEILKCATVGAPFWMHRLNFWRDSRSICPKGRAVGNWICRLAPRHCPVQWGSEGIETGGKGKDSNIQLFHYGFIRDGTGFRKKAEIMHTYFHGSVPQIIYDAEKYGIQHLKNDWPESELIPFKGTHPKVAIPWLQRHGYEL